VTDAQRQLVIDNLDLVQTMVRKRWADRDTVESAAQWGLLLAAMQDDGSIRDFRGFARTIIWRTVMHELRPPRLNGHFVVNWDGKSCEPSRLEEDAVERQEQIERFRFAVSVLPGRQRVIVDHLVGGLGPLAIARKMGRGRDAVCQMKARAFRFLRAMLAE